MNQPKPPEVKRIRLNKAKLIALVNQAQKIETKIDIITDRYYAVHKR